MKVLLAANAGFCMGVRRAVETTLDMVHREDEGLATFGPLIHNPQVLDLLKQRGVTTLDEIPRQTTGTIIIRAHGIPPAQKKRLQASGARIKDATCPRVLKVQAIINKYRKQGYTTVIIGDRNHAEVEGLMGYAEPKGVVVSTMADVASLALDGPYIIVSQTTQDEAAFHELSTAITSRFPAGKIYNTICDSTHKRQEEVRSLSRKVEAMVVVGGRNSANTTRLGEIAESMGRPVFMAETEADLDLAALRRFSCVGVTAGASTPTWMINRVVRTLETLPGKDEGLFRSLLARLLWLLLATNIYVGLAGGLMATGAGLLLGDRPRLESFLLAAGYLFAMHNLNRFADREATQINDPIRALFYTRYRWPLILVSSLTLAGALAIAAQLGRGPFLLLAAMSIAGILYSVRFIPKVLLPITRIRRLKEIPGSKTFFVALAWALATVLIPSWAGRPQPPAATLAVFLFVLALLYVRCALLDVFEVLSDRIVGKETLPVCIGEKKTLVLLHSLMAGLVVLLVAAPLAGWMTPAGYWQIPVVAYFFMLARMYVKEHIRQGPRLEFALDSGLYLSALLAWLGAL